MISFQIFIFQACHSQTSSNDGGDNAIQCVENETNQEDINVLQPSFDFNDTLGKSKKQPKDKNHRLTRVKNQTRNMEETDSFQDDTSNVFSEYIFIGKNEVLSSIRDSK